MYACGGTLRSCSYTQDFGGASGAENDNEARQHPQHAPAVPTLWAQGEEVRVHHVGSICIYIYIYIYIYICLFKYI